MNHRLAHGGAAANAIAGIGLSQIVLACFGIEFREALALNATMFCVSYARSYLLRLLFGGLAAPVLEGHPAGSVGDPKSGLTGEKLAKVEAVA